MMKMPEGIDLFEPIHHMTTPLILPVLPMYYPPPPAYRLGLQFEDVIEQLFKYSKNSRLLHRNLKIKNANRVLGELDCLYENATRECVHLELAIKFYLFHTPFRGIEDFIGPGGRDRLDIKWRRLTLHQLPLSSTLDAIKIINSAGHNTPHKQELLLTGILFYPYSYWKTCKPGIDSLDPHHNRGWWLYQHQIDLLLSELKSRFIILPRWHWVGGLNHYEIPEPLDHGVLRDKVLNDNEPKMVAVIKWNVKQQEWQEKSRGFIVRNDWPESGFNNNSKKNRYGKAVIKHIQ